MTVTMKQLLIVIMIVILTVVIEMVRNNICKQYFKGVVTGIPVYRIRLGRIFVRFPKFGTKKAIFHFYSRVSNRLILAANGSSFSSNRQQAETG